MSARIRAFQALGVLLCASLVGCGDTREQIKAMDQAIQTRQTGAAAALADRLIANPELIRSGDVQIYLSSSLAERSLKLLDNLELEIPDSGGVKVRVGAVRVTFSDGVAGLRIDMNAIKGDLAMKVVAAAILLPEKLPPKKLSDAEIQALKPADPSIPVALASFYRTNPLQFRVQIVEFAPAASWGPFSSDLKGFVTEFGRLKVNEFLNKNLPAIELPFDQIVTLDQKAESRDIPVQDLLTVRVTTPPVKWSTTFSITEVIVLERGIHIAGGLKRTDMLDDAGAPK